MQRNPIDDIVLSMPFSGNETRAYPTRYYWNNWKRGRDAFVIIQLTLKGEGVFRWNGDLHRVPEGHAFIGIVPERSEYFLPSDSREAWSFSWLNFYGKASLDLWRRFRDQWGPVVPMPLDSEAGTAFFDLQKQLIQGVSDRFEHGAHCYAFLMKWMRILTRPVNVPEGPVEHAIRSCKTRFHEPLGVKVLADEAGMTREHFTRLFRQRVGIPPGLFLRRLRMEAARELLAGTTLPLREIAMRCGLSSPRALMGLRPGKH